MNVTLNPTGTYRTDIFDDGAAEIVAHDPATQRLFITNGSDKTVDVVSIADPSNPTKLFTLTFPAPFEGLAPTSVAVSNDTVAVAVPAAPVTDPGHVLFFDTDGNFEASFEVGALPDMLTFTADGEKVLVANEGEPDDGIDPEGSVSIIDISSGNASATVETATFTAFNGREAELQAKGVRLFPDSATANDVEPEYIAVSPDGTKAFVTLQENNAFGVVDIATATVEDILPLGVKDHAAGQPQLETIDLTDMLPDLGTTAAGQTLKLGGLSGLWYDGTTEDGTKEFWTVPDRGPNPDTIDGDRPFALPDYQARLHKIEVAADGTTQFTDTIYLTREVDGVQVPITGISNNASDETPIDIYGDPVDFDAFGGDLEGVARDSDGNFWLVDEYRPAIYKFDSEGVLVDRFVPEGTAALVGDDAGNYGSETLPEEFASRRPNRGFEAVAIDQDNDVVYAFIQTPLANPDRDTSDNSDVIRILGIDAETGQPVSEHVYLLEGLDFRDSTVDKIGDAVYAGDGTFYVVERDSSTEAFGKKFIFKVDLKGATNLLDPSAPVLPAGETLEQQTADDLADLGIQAVNKIKMLNLPSIGYLAGDKPEGLALLDDGSLAVLNDNDFSLTGDLDTTTGEVGVVEPTSPTVLGFITFDDNNGLDASDEDGAINIQNWPIYGLYMPDAIASFEVDGQAFYITANEGDARDEDARIKDLDLDPDAFPNAAELQADENLGRLTVSTIDGDIDGDGDYDQLFTYGGRSFSIWDQFGNLVFDSGDDFEKTVAKYVPEYFNSDNDDSTFDTRSDAKGPEPEGVTIGIIDGTPYAFIGLERVGGVMAYDVSDPTNPRFVGYDNNRDFAADPETAEAGDLAPEGLAFISADDSPTGEPLLVVANEVSGSTTVNEIDETFTLQLLHASDLEGGVDAIGRAPNFAAIIDALEDSTDVDGSITMSAGDNYISGPFFSAAGDEALRAPLQDVNTRLFEDLLGGEELSNLREASGRVDISIMNIVGFDASAFGNHEFDLGTSTIAEIIGTDIRGDTLGDVRWLGSQFPYLSANLDFSGDDNLSRLFNDDILPNTAFQSSPDDLDAAADAPKIAPSTIIEVNGELIGVVGATTPLLETISSPGDTSVKNPGAGTNDMAALATILQPVIDDLIAEGINKIVLTTHLQQITLEQELIPLLSGVDISIAGGSDTLLANNDDALLPGHVAAGPYPIVTTDLNGDPAVIVSTDGEYSYVGRLVVNFDADGILVDADGNPIDETEDLDPSLNGPIATTEENVEALWGDEDPFAAGTKGALTKELTDAVAEVVNTKDGNVFGESEVFLDGRREQVRTEETNLGDVTADANLQVAQGYDDTVLVSIKNGGGIRAPIGQVVNDGDETVFLPPQANPNAAPAKEDGQVSQLDDENALRFNNELTLVTLTPEQLLEVLEHGVSATADGATPGQFPQVGGIQFSFDPSQQARESDPDTGEQITAGERIQSAAIVTDDGLIPFVKDGEIVDSAPEAIRVVTLNFLAGGGDGYPFAFFASQDPDFADVVDLVDELTNPGLVDFADPGTEQDALAEYFATNHPVDGDTPFNVKETPVEEDTRIQNLQFRDDEVLGAEKTGTDGDDTLTGTIGDDTLSGLGGDDSLDGGLGDDSLIGGEGDDTLSGGNGGDYLAGDAGDDLLMPGLNSGTDTVDGGEGNDTVDYTDAGDAGFAVRVDLEDGMAEIAPPSMMSGRNGYFAQELFTVGETVNGYTPAGVLDGMGAYAYDADTIRVLVNHEISPDEGGYTYEVSDGSGGTFELSSARISYFDINKFDLSIEDSGAAFERIYDRNGDLMTDPSQFDIEGANSINFNEDTGMWGFNRFCSSGLFEPESFGDDQGLVDRVYFTGEETAGGTEWAVDVENGDIWAVPMMGRGNWENITLVDTGVTDKVAFILGDDSQERPLYLYVGEKDTSEGAGFLARNGLADGDLYMWKSATGETQPSQFLGAGNRLDGEWVKVPNHDPAKAGTEGYDAAGYLTQDALLEFQEAQGAFKFSRPEDVATNPEDGMQVVLASTGRPGVDNGADTWGTLYIIDAAFDESGEPTGARLSILYDGDADPSRALRSPDNLDWADDGYIYVQEDRANGSIFAAGNNTNEASIVRLDPSALGGDPVQVGEIDRTSVLPLGVTDGDPDDVGNWESSGILDVSALFDKAPGEVLLFDVQAHSISDGIIEAEGLVQGGQLNILYSPEAELFGPTPEGTDEIDDVENVVGTKFSDIIDGDDNDNKLEGAGGEDTMQGREGDDTLDGGADDDSLNGGEGDDTLMGGDDDDVLEGGGDDDTLDGGDGDDTLMGDAGDDGLAGNVGDDFLDGGDDDDTLDGGDGDDTLMGGEGDDTVMGGDGDDIVAGDGAGAGLHIRFLEENAGFRSVYGWYDTESLEAKILLGDIDSMANPDLADFKADLPVDLGKLNQTGFFLIPNGYPLNNWGNKPLAKGDPTDLNLKVFDDGGEWKIKDIDSGHVFKGQGNAAYFSDASKNADGKDHIMLKGELADGHVEQYWEDRPDLGDGDFNDLVMDIKLVFDEHAGGEGDDDLFGGLGDDTLIGGRGDDDLSGDRGDDLLAGGSGDDNLEGGRDDDMLRGDEGDDDLSGDRGDDTLDGGKGDDDLTGGRGDDLFLLDRLTGVDLITDFEMGEDIIDVSAFAFADFDDLLDSAKQDGGDLIIELDNITGDTLILEDISKDDLGEADFILS